VKAKDCSNGDTDEGAEEVAEDEGTRLGEGVVDGAVAKNSGGTLSTDLLAMRW
jgi:hypothetical protein